MLALAAGLWLVYLVPNWLRRKEFVATERNAVRPQRTIRVMAETAEAPVVGGGPGGPSAAEIRPSAGLGFGRPPGTEDAPAPQPYHRIPRPARRSHHPDRPGRCLDRGRLGDGRSAGRRGRRGLSGERGGDAPPAQPRCVPRAQKFVFPFRADRAARTSNCPPSPSCESGRRCRCRSRPRPQVAPSTMADPRIAAAARAEAEERARRRTDREGGPPPARGIHQSLCRDGRGGRAALRARPGCGARPATRLSGPAVTDWDVVIVGAGPAGSAAAVAALRSRPDARVLLLDREPEGRDKVCGDGIAPHAMAELSRLGIDATRPEEVVDAVRLVAPGSSGETAVTDDPGSVVPRRTFDARMLAGRDRRGSRLPRAAGNPADLDVSFGGAVVIGADGAQLGGPPRATGQPSNKERASRSRSGLRADALRCRARAGAGRWDRRRAGGLCYAWAFPTAEGTTNVGYGMSSAALGHDRASLERRLGELLPEYDLSAGRAHRAHASAHRSQAPGPPWGGSCSPATPHPHQPVHGGGGAAAAPSCPGHSRARPRSRPPTPVRSTRGRSNRRFGRQHRQARWLYPLVDSKLVLNTVVRASQRSPRMFQRLLDVGLGDRAFSPLDFLRFGRYLLP